MSGSPIIQDGKLVGAVTHVMVADPTEGYGIFIENMLNASQTARNELPAAWIDFALQIMNWYFASEIHELRQGALRTRAIQFMEEAIRRREIMMRKHQFMTQSVKSLKFSVQMPMQKAS